MNTPTTPLLRRAGALAVAVALGLTACGSDDDTGSAVTAVTDTGAGSQAVQGVTIADPWSRQPAEGQTRTAVYGVVSNDTDEAITAIGASSPVTGRVELHETLMADDGVMSMQERAGGYEIAPGESLTFEPGGPHVMLFDIDPATYPAMVDMTLEFDNGLMLDFTAEVRQLDGMDSGTMDSGTMDSGTMDG